MTTLAELFEDVADVPAGKGLGVRLRIRRGASAQDLAWLRNNDFIGKKVHFLSAGRTAWLACVDMQFTIPPELAEPRETAAKKWHVPVIDPALTLELTFTHDAAEDEAVLVGDDLLDWEVVEVITPGYGRDPFDC